MNNLSLQGSLYLVCDPTHGRRRSIAFLLEEAIRGGVGIVQLREKQCSHEEFVTLVRSAVPVLKAHGIPLIINDRIDIAISEGTQGVHLGQSDLPWNEARRLLGPHAILGLSVETPAQALIAQDAAVDYLGVSSIFSTDTKKDARSFWGLEGLNKLKASSKLPLVAIGGIDASNAQAVIESGADSVAVISAVCAHVDPKAASFCLKAAIDRGILARKSSP